MSRITFLNLVVFQSLIHSYYNPSTLSASPDTGYRRVSSYVLSGRDDLMSVTGWVVKRVSVEGQSIKHWQPRPDWHTFLMSSVQGSDSHGVKTITKKPTVSWSVLLRHKTALWLSATTNKLTIGSCLVLSTGTMPHIIGLVNTSWLLSTKLCTAQPIRQNGIILMLFFTIRVKST